MSLARFFLPIYAVVAWVPGVDEADPYHGLQEPEMPDNKGQTGKKHCKLRKAFHRGSFDKS